MDKKSPTMETGPEADEKPVELPKEMADKIKSGDFDFDEVYEINPNLQRIITEKLFEMGRGDLVAQNLEKFEGLDKEAAMKLIEAGKAVLVAGYLGKFEGLDKEVAMKLIEKGYGHSVAWHSEKFEGLDHQEMADKLIETGQNSVVAENLGKFDGLDKQVAAGLIEKGEATRVAQNLEKFKGLDHQETADTLIEIGEGHQVAKNLEKFKGLNHAKVAEKLLKANEARAIADNLEKFEGLDHQKMADKLIETGKGTLLAYNLEKFKGLNHAKVAEKLLKANEARAIADNLEKFEGLDHQKIADKLIKAGNGYWLAKNLEKFEGLDHQKIADRLIEAGEGSAVICYSEKFKGLNLNKEVAMKLIEMGKGYTVVENLEKFEGLNKEVAMKLIEEGNGGWVARHLERFEGLDKEVAIKLIREGIISEVAYHLERFEGLDNEVAMKLIEEGNGGWVASNLKRFEGLDKEAAMRLIDEGKSDWVARHLERFEGLDKEAAMRLFFDEGKDNFVAHDLRKFEGLDKEVAMKLIETGKGYTVAENLEKFEGLDHQETADKLIETDSGFSVAENLEKFKGLNYQEMADRLIETGKGKWVAKNLEKFKGLDKEIGKKLFDEALKEYFPLAIKINEYFNDEFDKILSKTYQDFGEQVTFEIYKTYKELENENLPKQAKELGVKHTGKTGMNELKKELRNVQNKFINGELDEREILESKLEKKWIMSIVRYEGADWGSHGEDSFNQIVQKYIEVKDEVRPLPKEYEQSKELNIAKVDKEKQAEFKHSEDFLVRYGTLLGSIKEARVLIDQKNPLNRILDFIQEKREVVLEKLNERIAEQTNPKAIENLKKRKQQLKSIDLEVLSNPQDAFNALRAFKPEFDEELREIMFYFAFCANPEQQRKNLSEFDAQDPSLDELSWVLNFVDHITNRETLKKYFTDKKAAKNFKGLLNISALEHEMARWQNQTTKGTMAMKFVPSRDLLTEFSGHIGDTCWASEYDSILQEFPNFVSLTVIQNPDDPKHERLAGSSLLIETVGKDNEPLLVIRGLNPLENLINQLDVKDFYNNLIEYLKPIAEKAGRKLAIVIDEDSGGSGTNRPVLFNYLNQLKRKLKQVKLKTNEGTEFNDYDIRNDCYLVE